MPWVTIDGNHVFIDEDKSTGQGVAPAPHLVGQSTGERHSQAAVSGKLTVGNPKDLRDPVWGSTIRSRLEPALENPRTGAVTVGRHGQHHWQVPHGIGTVAERGLVRGYVDPATRKFYDAIMANLDTTDLYRR